MTPEMFSGRGRMEAGTDRSAPERHETLAWRAAGWLAGLARTGFVAPRYPGVAEHHWLEAYRDGALARERFDAIVKLTKNQS